MAYFPASSRDAADRGGGSGLRGRSLRESFELCSRGFSVTSYDLDEATLNAYFADYRWPRRKPQIVTNGGLGQFSGKQFSLITAFDVFEHLERPEESLAEMRDALAPGGLIFCTVPNRWTLFEIILRIYWKLGLRIVGRMINDVQFKDFAFQQAQRPFRAAFGRLRASQGDEPGLFLAVEDARNGRRRTLLAVQYRVHAALRLQATASQPRLQMKFRRFFEGFSR